MKSAAESTKAATEAGNPNVETYGEVFPDGSMIELVASATGEPSLLYFREGRVLVHTEIQHAGRIYQAQELPPSILRATRLPRQPVDYGTIRHLFSELQDTFEQYLGFSRSSEAGVMFWVLTTWFCDCLSIPPTLWAQGAELDLATRFFQLLHCVCRRPLRLTGVNRANFLTLPFDFRPVLLMNQSGLPIRLQELFCESNSRGSVVLGNRGQAFDVTCSKAIFLGMWGTPPPPDAGNFHIALYPADHELPLLDERTLNAIADYFQPRLLQYRLDCAKAVRESQFVVSDLRLRTREFARILGACIQGDPDLALQAVAVARSQDEIANRCTLDHAIIGVLWPRVHSNPTSVSTAKMKIGAHLTPELNTYLRGCGETCEYTPEEVGKRVAKLGLSRKPTNAGTVLLLDRETTLRVHALARGYGMDKSVPGCPDCGRIEPSAE